MSLFSSANTFVPQNESFDCVFMKEVAYNTEPLPLPETILEDIKGIINAVNHRIGINKFLFEGYPGTGKTETVKQVARLLDRSLYMVEFSELIDSKMGQTAKNVVTVFNEINRMPNPSKVIILFDEFEAFNIDSVNLIDFLDIGRGTSTILKEMGK